MRPHTRATTRPRTQTKVTAQTSLNRNRSQPLLMLNKRLIAVDMNKIDIYSDKIIITKRDDLYSVLNPLTSSDSPSEKSNGERFVSANALISNKSIGTKRKTTVGIILSLYRL